MIQLSLCLSTTTALIDENERQIWMLKCKINHRRCACLITAVAKELLSEGLQNIMEPKTVNIFPELQPLSFLQLCLIQRAVSLTGSYIKHCVSRSKKDVRPDYLVPI